MKYTNPEWLTVKQACRRLKVSRNTLFRMIDQGEVPAYRIGWMIRLRVAEVEAYLQERDDPED
jgi:excisionase family DNA binding protein